MTVQDVLRKTQVFFQGKGFETARLDAEILLSHALGWPRVQLYTKFDYPMSEQELEICRRAVRRRADGEPVAYIVGKRAFYKDDFFVSSDVLIPRPETELIVEKAAEILQSRKDERLHLADFGTGSGCLGLSLLREFPNARLTAVDISEKALQVARKNAEHLGLAERVNWIHADLNVWTSADRFDLIAANPPYIDENDRRLQPEVRKYEPRQALIAAGNGLAEIFSWSRAAMKSLKENGPFLCEVGDGQRSEIERFFARESAKEVRFHQDYARIDRFFEIVGG